MIKVLRASLNFSASSNSVGTLKINLWPAKHTSLFGKIIAISWESLLRFIREVWPRCPRIPESLNIENVWKIWILYKGFEINLHSPFSSTQFDLASRAFQIFRAHSRAHFRDGKKDKNGVKEMLCKHLDLRFASDVSEITFLSFISKPQSQE